MKSQYEICHNYGFLSHNYNGLIFWLFISIMAYCLSYNSVSHIFTFYLSFDCHNFRLCHNCDLLFHNYDLVSHILTVMIMTHLRISTFYHTNLSVIISAFLKIMMQNLRYYVIIMTLSSQLWHGISDLDVLCHNYDLPWLSVAEEWASIIIWPQNNWNIMYRIIKTV